MPKPTKVLRMTDVAYWVGRGYSRTEAKHRAKFTARGTPRKNSEERSKVHKRVWRDAWADGSRVKAPKKKLLSKAERSQRAKDAWETRRKRLLAAERKAAKQRRERRAHRVAREQQKHQPMLPVTQEMPATSSA